MKNKTTREGERILAEDSKLARIPNEYERQIKNDRVQITFSLKNNIYQRLKVMKSKHKVYKLEDLLIKLLEQNDSKLRSRLRVTTKETKGRYISRSVKEEVRQRDKYRCVICKTTMNLEFDHHTPYSKGGGNRATNIRLLCKSCNQRQAIKKIGLETMSRYIS